MFKHLQTKIKEHGKPDRKITGKSIVVMRGNSPHSGYIGNQYIHVYIFICDWRLVSENRGEERKKDREWET